MSKLTGRTALVTGGGSGIGLEVARQLLREGARVAITGRDAAKLRHAADTLAAGDRLFWHPADISRPEAVTALVDACLKQFGHLDVLVNNAGVNIKERRFRELTPDSYALLMGGNVHGAFLVTRAVLPAMLERKDGVIIFVNSTSGLRAGPLGGAAYAAAKFGLRGLAMALAAEELGNGVRVHSIYPGEVDTPILEARPTPVSEQHRRSILRPEDVASAVLFVPPCRPTSAFRNWSLRPWGNNLCRRRATRRSTGVSPVAASHKRDACDRPLAWDFLHSAPAISERSGFSEASPRSRSFTRRVVREMPRS